MTSPTSGASVAVKRAYKLRYTKAEAALLEELRQRCGGELQKGGLFAKHGTTDFQLSFLPKQQGYEVSVVLPARGSLPGHAQGSPRPTDGGLRTGHPHSVPATPASTATSTCRRATCGSPPASSPRQPNRAAVWQLFEQGVRAVLLDGDRIKAIGKRKALGDECCRRGHPGPGRRARPDRRRNVTAFAARHGARPSPKNDPVVVISWTALGVLGVLGFAMLIAGAIEYHARAAGALPAAVCALRTARRRARRHSRWPSPCSAAPRPTASCADWPGSRNGRRPALRVGRLLLSNGLLDSTPAEEHVVTVVGKSVKKDKNEADATTPAWRPGGSRATCAGCRISKATYDLLEPNVSLMQVRTHPGKLGYEWFESYTVSP